RFYRDDLKNEVRRELNWLQAHSEPRLRWENDPGLMPSLVQLRSLLLNETPAELATVAAPDQFTGPAAGIIASCLAILRTSHPTRFERLIPGGEPSPFVAGLEREVAGPHPHLVAFVQQQKIDEKTTRTSRTWPQPVWPEWKTPSGARWTFGAAKPIRVQEPSRV